MQNNVRAEMMHEKDTINLYRCLPPPNSGGMAHQGLEQCDSKAASYLRAAKRIADSLRCKGVAQFLTKRLSIIYDVRDKEAQNHSPTLGTCDSVIVSYAATIHWICVLRDITTASSKKKNISDWFASGERADEDIRKSLREVKPWYSVRKYCME